MDRRAVFFFGAACVCALLIPVAPSKFRWVPAWLAIVYVLLTLLSMADYLARRREDDNELTRSGP